MITGSVLAGAAASCLAPGSGVLSASKAHAARVDFPESNCGPKNKAGKKVLVAYASYCGTTGGVAEAIGRVLCDAGADTDVRLVKNVDDVSAYSAVIVGSAVRSIVMVSRGHRVCPEESTGVKRDPRGLFPYLPGSL